jgi:hypothetical protein
MAIKTWKELLQIISPNIDPSKVVLTQISVSLNLPDGREVVLPIRKDSTIESLKKVISPPLPPKEPFNPVTTSSSPQKMTPTMTKFMYAFFNEEDYSEFEEFVKKDKRALEFFKNTSNPIETYGEEYTSIEGLTDLEKFKNFLSQISSEQTEDASQSPTEPTAPSSQSPTEPTAPSKRGPTLTNKKKVPTLTNKKVPGKGSQTEAASQSPTEPTAPSKRRPTLTNKKVPGKGSSKKTKKQ